MSTHPRYPHRERDTRSLLGGLDARVDIDPSTIVTPE
jgi:hypothetical protein